MFVEKLTLREYRNIEKLRVMPHEKCNIIIGENAQGKTNLIESIYLCAFGKSHRTKEDLDIIAFNKDYCHVSMDFSKDHISRNITVYLSNKEKKIIVDNNAIKRRSELLGAFSCVLFSPLDLNIIKGTPSIRRKYVDSILSQIYPRYFEMLIRYLKVLKQRNTDLKGKAKLIEVYDAQIAPLATEINGFRYKFIKKIEKTINEISFLEKEKIQLCYSCTQESAYNTELFIKELYKNRSKDLRYQTTAIGPHREDFNIFVNNKDAKHFASQGQQRSVAILLKMGELSLLKDITGNSPVLLLDDVMSELDEFRQQRIFDFIKETQTFITTNALNFKQEGRVFTMKNGVLS